AVEGCAAWQHGGLGTAESVREATEAYRHDMDVLGAFIDEVCVLGEALEETTKRLFAGYVKWCAGEKPMSKRAFGLRLGERGFEPTRSGRARGWRGIALISDAMTDD